jgi:hypothetical protein
MRYALLVPVAVLVLAGCSLSVHDDPAPQPASTTIVTPPPAPAYAPPPPPSTTTTTVVHTP